jgi:hypothetical protein
MKRACLLTILLAAALAWPCAAAADGGVKGGVAVSTLANAGAWSWGTGYTVGAFASVRLFELVRLQPEILVTRKATSAQLDDGVTSATSTVKIDYLEFPLVLARALRSGGGWRPVVYGGGFVAARLRARATSQVGDASIDEDLADEIRSTDAGVVAGIRIEIPGRGARWLVDVRYCHGLTQVSDHGAAQGGRTRSVEIAAGLAWPRSR